MKAGRFSGLIATRFSVGRNSLGTESFMNTKDYNGVAEFSGSVKKRVLKNLFLISFITININPIYKH